MKRGSRIRLLWILAAAAASALLAGEVWDPPDLSLRCTAADCARGGAQMPPYAAASQPLPVSPNASWEALFLRAQSR